MFKIITSLSVITVLVMFFWRIWSEHNIYNPEYQILSQNNPFEIRKYETLNLITTSEKLPYKEATYSGFRTLANYIFGNNKKNIKIPMTAPVISSSPDQENVNISFILGKEFSIRNMPEPNTNKITFEELQIGKVAVIKFGLWATPKKINIYIKKLVEYLDTNSISYSPDFFVAQYNSPWVLPPFRKNEIMVSIK